MPLTQKQLDDLTNHVADRQYARIMNRYGPVKGSAILTVFISALASALVASKGDPDIAMPAIECIVNSFDDLKKIYRETKTDFSKN